MPPVRSASHSAHRLEIGLYPRHLTHPIGEAHSVDLAIAAAVRPDETPSHPRLDFAHAPHLVHFPHQPVHFQVVAVQIALVVTVPSGTCLAGMGLDHFGSD